MAVAAAQPPQPSNTSTMQPALALSVEVVPATLAPSETSRSIRAVAMRCVHSGFCAWVATRPVLWNNVRAALVMLRGQAVQPALGMIRSRLEVVHSHIENGTAAVYVPWELHERLQDNIQQVHLLLWRDGLLRADEAVSAPTPHAWEPSSSLPAATSQSGRCAPSQMPRYSRTPEGMHARRVLVEFVNAPPGLMGRFTSPKRWELPGIQFTETARRREVIWRLRFDDSTVENRFLARCRELPPNVEQAFEDASEADGAGMTLIGEIVLTAAADDLSARKEVAAFLWSLLNELWAAGQREAVLLE